MEQHPVPQNVTTFQFRLIGDMTIKQFGYLAGGAIMAYVSYKLPLPFFFTWPLTILFGLGGVGFAFVPIEERPMDTWVMAFIKNVYSPTMFVWEKSTQPQQAQTQIRQPAPMQPQRPPAPMQPQRPPAPAIRPTAPAQPNIQQPAASKTKADVLAGMYRQNQAQVVAPAPQQNPPPVTQQPVQPTLSPAPRASNGLFGWLSSLFSPKAPKAPPLPPVNTSRMVQTAADIANPSITGRHLDVSMPPAVRPVRQNQKQQPQTDDQNDKIEQEQQKEKELESKLTKLQDELASKSVTETRVLELQKQLSEVLAQRDAMEAEIRFLKKQSTQPRPVQPVAPPVAPPAPKQQPQKQQQPPGPRQPTVKIITPEGAVKAGLPRLTTFPNVVTGIIKDGVSNLLPGVLVTVKDKDGVPVRALKTNRLGQFAASTPLANGVYYVEIEDPRGRYTFDRVQITLNGSVVPALEIIAKSQKEISRDKLAKELFGNQ